MLISERLVLTAMAVIVSIPAFAITPTSGERIGILQTAERHHGRMERLISETMPRVLAEELRKSGVDARVLTRTIDDADRTTEIYDLLLEVVYYDADAGYNGGIGFGRNGVGAEVAMAYAQVDARVTIYDAKTREELRSFDLQAHTTSPVLAGVGIGGRDGFLFVHLPFRARYPHRRVTRAFAKEAARQIATR